MFLPLEPPHAPACCLELGWNVACLCLNFLARWLLGMTVLIFLHLTLTLGTHSV